MAKKTEQTFDRAAFIAAVKASSAPAPLRVEVEGLGACYIRAITAGQGSEIADYEPCDKKHTNARNAAIVLCDADGVLLFDPRSKDDLEQLSGLKAATINKILKAANEHNGWVETEKKD
ncbi:hypothetical protein [Undibacterium sp.]|uniref:hypothetical protein n=1 Tax=Undibacterium sp. TaxID=1914977 RepID=UPI0037529E0D